MNDKKFSTRVFMQGWQDTISPIKENRWNLLKNAFVGCIAAIVTYSLGGEPELMSYVIALVAGIGGALLWGVLTLGKNIILAPSKIYYEQIQQLELFTTKSIDIIGFTPDQNDVRPAGILVRNNKGVPISCAAWFKRIWRDRTQFAKNGLPIGLRWFENGYLATGYKLIKSGENALIAIEHIKTERERGATRLTVGSYTEQEEFGECVGIETGGQIGIAVYDIGDYQIEIQFRFVIEGLNLAPRIQRYSLGYDGEQLKIEKVSDLEIEDINERTEIIE
jgi:hypothetical protein